MRRTIAPVTALIVFAAACATVDDAANYRAPAGSTDQGRVCLYRTVPRLTPGVWLTFTMDGQWTGEIRPDRQYCVDTYAGRHIVRVDGTNHILEFDLHKDESFYVRFDEAKSYFQPVQVDTALGAHEYDALRKAREQSEQSRSR